MTWSDEWTVAAIAEVIRSGTARPDEPAAEALRRITERDGRIGAFVRVRADRAMAEAAALAGRPDLADPPLARGAGGDQGHRRGHRGAAADRVPGDPRRAADGLRWADGPPR
jgi:hypothetical protein